MEDTEELAELIKEALNQEPEYQAVAVGDAARALEMIQSVKVDLILLDVNLPGMNGIELYDKLQEDEATRRIPVLFVTANVSEPSFRRREFPHALAKPFDLTELLEHVAAICDNNAGPMV